MVDDPTTTYGLMKGVGSGTTPEFGNGSPGPFDERGSLKVGRCDLIGFFQRFIGPKVIGPKVVDALGTVTVFVGHEMTMSALKTGFVGFSETVSVKKFTATRHHVTMHDRCNVYIQLTDETFVVEELQFRTHTKLNYPAKVDFVWKPCFKVKSDDMIS